jgi:hypothetical protein
MRTIGELLFGEVENQKRYIERAGKDIDTLRKLIEALPRSVLELNAKGGWAGYGAAVYTVDNSIRSDDYHPGLAAKIASALGLSDSLFAEYNCFKLPVGDSGLFLKVHVGKRPKCGKVKVRHTIVEEIEVCGDELPEGYELVVEEEQDADSA